MNPHCASFSRQPLAHLALAFCTGICVTSYFPIQFFPLFIAGGVLTVAAFAAALKGRLALAGVALLFATACAGGALAVQQSSSEQHDALRQFLGQRVILTGVLQAPPEVGRDRLYVTLAVTRVDADAASQNISSIVALSARLATPETEQAYRDLQLRYGARIRVEAKLNRDDEYQNPGVSPLSEYLDRRGYDAIGFVNSPAAITRLERAPTYAPLALLYSWRERLQEKIDATFQPDTASVLNASLLGNRYGLSRETSERFREGGTFHVLVISGLHISFIGGVVFLLLTRVTRRKWLRFLGPALCVWGYAFAVGAESSVVRAALMFTFGGVALVLFRESSSLNALGAATLVLLVRSPKEIFDPSFQLTFLSVLAIVAIAWPLLQTCAAIGAWYPSRDTPQPPHCSRALRSFCEALFWSERRWAREIGRSTHRYRLFKTPLAAFLERYRVQACLRYVFAAVVVSSTVQLVLLPLTIVYFHRLSPAALVLNIVVSALLAVLTAVALLALLLAPLSATLAAPLIHLADATNWLMVHSVEPFSRFHLASIRVPEYSGWSALIYVVYFIPLLVLVLMRRWRLPAALAQLLLVIAIIVHQFSEAPAQGKLRIDFLDVGQGDAAVITLPDGRTLLIDAGGRPEPDAPNEADRRSIGEAVVSEYLWWRGLDTVDYVLATHADADHIDGLNDVLRNFTVDAALVARTPANDPEYAKFARTVTTTHTNLATIQAGDVIHLSGVEIDVLWPPATRDQNAPSRNNDSIVVKLTYGNRTILMTGDIEKAAEHALTDASIDLHADVVKVAHHGSKTSSTATFVSKTHAQTAIISVGQYSMFGHPHREVVERWQASGADVLTTGRCGTITVTTDGTDLLIEGMRSRTSRGFPCPLDH